MLFAGEEHLLSAPPIALLDYHLIKEIFQL
nr:MAG TPA: Ragulator complex protein LAMTOR1, Ragulator complex, LAMTOR, SIGNALING PROTEIN.65A [Caudoviricetes sp.]DAY11501.1 MAG TPA: Ragulator complex protein LAMTOR1, Ragulator complex, LAMTOR, SIGNALING PROTEIN.65A [Caudoviricetes sp.]